MSTALAPQLEPIIWAALERVSAKQGCRDQLESGDSHEVHVRLEGDVDGEHFAQNVSAVLTVGHEQQKAASATPDQPRLIGAILAKLNATTREKILRELPEEFAASGGELPDVAPELTSSAEGMLRRLRAKKTVTARGAVRCDYQLVPRARSGSCLEWFAAGGTWTTQQYDIRSGSYKSRIGNRPIGSMSHRKRPPSTWPKIHCSIRWKPRCT